MKYIEACQMSLSDVKKRLLDTTKCDSLQMASTVPSHTYDEVKEEIHQLFVSSAVPSIDAGLTLTELCREYESCHKHGPIPYAGLGYDTLSRFLGSMKDVIQMNYNEWPTRCYLAKQCSNNQPKSKRRVRVFPILFCSTHYFFLA